MTGRALPVLTVLCAIVALWYIGAVFLNAQWTYDQAARAGEEVTFSALITDTMSQSRARLPAPHQVVGELWSSTLGRCSDRVMRQLSDGSIKGAFEQFVDRCLASPRSLLHQSGITLVSTLLGFGLGTMVGLLLAVGIVYSPLMKSAVTPWMIASQMVPIVAISPMIVVVIGSLLTSSGIFDDTPLESMESYIPKAIISAYLCFFPVAIGMIKGLRNPDQIQIDQMHTWNASKRDFFWKLRLPSSTPFFFASLKIGIAAALVGAVVGELSNSAAGGLGTRLVIGSQNGLPLMIWASIILAATMSAILVALVGLLQRRAASTMGEAP